MPDAISYDPVGLVKMLAEQECTETCVYSSLFMRKSHSQLGRLMTSTLLAAVLLRHADLATKLPKLRTLWLNGEVVSIDLARRATAALPKVRLLNCYSACETHEVACGDVGEMLPMLGPEATCCPVGQPMELEHCHILDEEGRPVGEGEAGELFVGGSLLAQGYLNMPETTAGVFVPDTFSAVEGARMYKTGDIARLIPSSGLLEITGRTGGMIKVRGFSIVPQTVEHAIVERLAVDSCAVIAHGQDLERQLVAYFVPSTEGETSDRPALVVDNNGRSPSARSALVQDLAHYMIPQLWIAVDLIPTHAVSGKADLKSLPTPAEGLSAAASRVASRVPSRTGSPVPDETINRKSMAGLWALSLNIDPATVLDTNGASFFDLGGHSLALANLATRISKTFGGFRVPLGELAGAPTLDGHLRVTLGARNGYVRAVQADLRSVLEADMALADDIKPTTSDVQLVPFRKAKCILLTGATGFLGGNLLHDLLEQTDAKIVCLIRFNAPYRTDRSAAMARLRNNMLDLGLWSNDILDRVEVIPSNLSRNRLGLIPEVYEELRQTLDIVVHCAAQVNLVYPYAALRDANVEGTREVLKLVALAGATLQYISTNGVLSPSTAGWSEDEMLPIDDVQTQLHDGYCQTKWVAEQMVLEAARRGLPAKVIRIGTLSGDSETGSVRSWSSLLGLATSSYAHRPTPTISLPR